ncbi:zinc finger BED domain-containing protein RICESLEEPER 4-like [Bidens hawaiensis]|uniref:zinc finger BED domain-containing protein RICESLEEPER 4-like n=1 Tax=Bidens hawaiensis TaxID=980011 RepID=UPI004049237B
MNKKDAPVIDVDEENLNEPVDSDQTVEQEGDYGKQSFMWKHFTRNKETDYSKCHYCKKFIKSGSKSNGTSGMGNHLTLYCRKSPLYIKVVKKQSTLRFKPKNSGEGKGSLITHTFNQERCIKPFVRMIIIDNLPFSVVDNQGLREFVWELNPMLDFHSR